MLQMISVANFVMQIALSVGCTHFAKEQKTIVLQENNESIFATKSVGNVTLSAPRSIKLNHR